MTEDEAKTKWCPFVRLSANASDSGVSGTFNRYSAPDFPDHPTVRCIGSACMAWRWNHEKYAEEMDAYHDSFNIGGINSRQEPILTGYCGLAGAPQ